MQPEAIVRSFCETARSRDCARLAGYFSDDAVYHNIPVDPVRGPEAIRKVLESFLAPASNVEFELLGIAAIQFTKQLA